VSELEQNVACSDNPNDQFRAITELIRSPAGASLDPLDVLRLVMLYTLRYERARPDRVAELRRFACDNVDGVRESIGLVDTLLTYGGAGVRGVDLFGTGNVFNKLSSTVRRGLQGVSNVFTQHEPHLVGLLDQLARGKLTKAAFPYVGAEPPQGKFSTVVVFIVGGATFEEAAKVAAINRGELPLGGPTGPGGTPLGGGAPSPSGAPGVPPFKVVIGGTTVLNSKAFLAELKRMHDGGVAIDVGPAGGGGGAAGGAGTGM
jgi:vacuolar protein sorting-associated protein 45